MQTANRNFISVCALIMATLLSAGTSEVCAQSRGTIQGTVRSESGQILQGVNVYIEGTNLGSVTDSRGRYAIDRAPVGEFMLTANFIGRESQTWRIDVAPGATLTKDFTLSVKPLIMPGIVVTASQTSNITESLGVLTPNVIRRSAAKVSGELIREVAGVDAARGGPVGLDPVVRGLRETQIGTYIDGSRMFPAGPLRMDSQISHVDPNVIQNIHVVKGPYALTLGAGNLSAITVETGGLRRLSASPVNGAASTGYHSNSNAVDGTASIFGSQGRFSYRASGTWREGDDYESGAGSSVPGDFNSKEVRGKLGFAFSKHSQLTFTTGYQRQDDIDYPGRLLDADFFNSYNYSARWQFDSQEGMLRSLNVMGYYNNVEHGMDNDNKPTAQPGTFANGNPRPPLTITVDSDIRVIGGRLAATLNASKGLEFEAGSDIYSANRDATRLLGRRDNGMLLFTDLMWPDATITDLGLFMRTARHFGDGFKLSASLRLDLVAADADTASEFFLENISKDLDQSETNLSGALTLTRTLSRHWLAALGVGSVVRTADATERYSDRIPASKAQTSAEFVGNPNLDPERSTQLDFWLEATYPKLSLNGNLFWRKLDNYITLQPTELAKRLPLSPETVFAYVNGEARFWGFEMAAAYQFNRIFKIRGAAQYLWGQDEFLDEAALGISPFGADGTLRVQSPSRKFFIEGTLHMVGKQDRVAATRGETPTEDYVTMDITAGAGLWQSLELRAGVTNLTDKFYVNHLNSKNPFTQQQIPEPGRVIFTNLSYAF